MLLFYTLFCIPVERQKPLPSFSLPSVYMSGRVISLSKYVNRISAQRVQLEVYSYYKITNWPSCISWRHTTMAFLAVILNIMNYWPFKRHRYVIISPLGDPLCGRVPWTECIADPLSSSQSHFCSRNHPLLSLKSYVNFFVAEIDNILSQLFQFSEHFRGKTSWLR